MPKFSISAPHWRKTASFYGFGLIFPPATVLKAGIIQRRRVAVTLVPYLAVRQRAGTRRRNLRRPFSQVSANAAGWQSVVLTRTEHDFEKDFRQ
jgi:hypothetical protein